MPHPRLSARSRAVSQVLTLLTILVAWFVLQRWVLPRFGIQT
jgi:hypothetical protein